MKKLVYLLLFSTSSLCFQTTFAKDSFDEAIGAIDSLIEEEDAQSLYDKGRLHYNKKTDEDYRIAADLFEKAAQLGDAYAADFLYVMGLMKQGVQPKDKTGWKIEMAKLGSPSAEHDLAHAYQKGDGVKKDLVLAARLFKSSARKGHKHAKNDTAYAYFYGRGVEKNDEQAMVWARKAAAHNIAMSQNLLGRLLGKSKSPADQEEAIKWFRSAEPLLKIEADKGNQAAAFARANLYNHGVAVKKDLEKAFSLYQPLAADGHVLSQDQLARMYWFGNGVKQDRLEARRWFKLAAEKGYPGSIKALEKINQ